MKIAIQILVLVIAFPYVGAALSCPTNCTAEACHNPANCTGSMVLDECKCCKRCAKREGETCGGKFNIHGPCDEGLNCVVTKKLSNTGICQRAPEEDLCKKKKCGFRQQCTTDKQGKAVCICPRNCRESKGRPVCGYKNGKQYKNPCELYRHECRTGKEIGRFNGPCKRCFHHGKPYRLGEARRGHAPCEKCVCYHGDWKCNTKKHCQDRIDFCTVFNDPKGGLISTCPPGYWCKVQIPSIPEQNIPGVGRCVPTKSDGDGVMNPCDLPLQVGPCRASISKWYYNKSRRKCMKFIFGGCGANANNFPTKSSCRIKCMRRRGQLVKSTASTKPTKPTTTIKTTTQPKTTEGSRNMTAMCNLPPAPGPCRAAMPQWFYNPKKQRCMRFIFGGCGGNENNFDTKDECKKACMRNKGTKPSSLTESSTRMSSDSESTTRTSPTSQITEPSTNTTQNNTIPTSTTPTNPTTRGPTTKRGTPQSTPETKLFSCPCSECPVTTGEETCETHYGCFTSQIQHTDGSQTVKYGCLENEEHYTIVCNVRSPDEKQPKMLLECCKGHMCNQPEVRGRTDVRQSLPKTSTTPTQATVVKKKVSSEIPRCFDAHSSKFYGENEEWKPNDCTVCACHGGQPECVATVCRHPNCVDPIRVKGQCCPVCAAKGNTTEDSQDMIKALAQSELTTVLVSIKKDKDKRFCEDMNSGELYMVGQNWKVDDCTTCYCQRDGKIACAVQMCNGYPGCPNPVKEKGHCCPVCPEEPEEELVSSENEVINSPHSCLDSVTRDHYRLGEMWQQDDCTACTCRTGRKSHCRKSMCKTPTCAKTIHLKGRCCPACEKDAKSGCVFEGQKYLPGEYKVLADHCTLCECKNLEWHCSTRKCRKNLNRGG
ncbi:cysteine-rich motor neuron 1 protein-like isoform X2 [Actinia tenebrosa]|uniref:Cysteine-rich motor neuron 1 protein-like isoform X2 n=1 Tax=Actinia tenebrosa TaxID=6105 RepID=A0A6P8HVB2_ACTTE|nr:cysteine-rich motor neuron 1 protein-like isoform X2 [Actinia tenebrosa]